MRKIILPVLFFQLVHLGLMAQDSLPKKAYKNTIRFNATNPLLFGGRSLIFGYERVLNNRRTFSINIGQAGLPTFSFLSADSIQAKSSISEKGYHISGDYRFYLSKENKYAAPRGVYIGPYFSYNYFERKNGWSLRSTNGGTAQDVVTTTSLTVGSIGFELGYQFIFWDRVSLDMILIGPGIAAYDLKASIGSNLSEADQQKLFDKLNDALVDKFPGFTTIFDNGEFQREGSSSKTSLGYRYMVMIGFRF
jgi:hypothetical protein